MNTPTETHKELPAWQRSAVLALAIYKLTEDFPKDERFGLTATLRKKATAIPSYIAEGKSRGANKDYVRLLRMALGAVADIESTLAICAQLPWAGDMSFAKEEALIKELSQMLKAMIIRLDVPEPKKWKPRYAKKS